MKCPHCQHPDDHVIDSRPAEDANVIRRRRECMGCHKRFTTYERCETMPMIVLKTDNRKEPFDRTKLREGIARACEKRPVSVDQIEKMVTETELSLQEDYVMEVPSHVIGDKVLAKLKEIDTVAYLRFASVYKRFSDADAYLDEIKRLKKKKTINKKKKETKGESPPISLVVTYSKN